MGSPGDGELCDLVLNVNSACRSITLVTIANKSFILACGIKGIQSIVGGKVWWQVSLVAVTVRACTHLGGSRNSRRSGEMAPWLKVFAAFSENLDLVPSIRILT